MVNLVGPDTPQNVAPQEANPNWLANIARGQGAQSELSNVLRGPQMQQAMQLQNARMAPLQQNGLATRTPTLFDAFAQMSQNHRGNQQAKALQAQAQALRGEAQAGQQAQLEQESFRRDEDYQRRLDAQKMAYEQNRNLAQEARAARGKEMRGDAETWVNNAGDQFNIYNTANGPVDSQGNPVNLDGMRRQTEDSKASFSKLMQRIPSADRRGALDSFDELSSLSDINAAARKFTPEDFVKLNQAGVDTAVKGLTPAAWENYVQNNLKDYSPAVKGYLEKVNAYSAMRRKNLSGTAVTVMENQLNQTFLPNATGSNFEDMARRIDSEAQRNINALQNIDRLYGIGVMERAPIYAPLADDERGEPASESPLKAPAQALMGAAQKQGPIAPPDFQQMQQQMQQMSARMQELQQKAGQP